MRGGCRTYSTAVDPVMFWTFSLFAVRALGANREVEAARVHVVWLVAQGHVHVQHVLVHDTLYSGGVHESTNDELEDTA